MGEGHLGDGLVDGALGLFPVQVPLDVLGVHQGDNAVEARELCDGLVHEERLGHRRRVGHARRLDEDRIQV